MSTVDRLQDEILLAIYEFRKFVALVCAFHEQPVTAEVFAEFFIEIHLVYEIVDIVEVVVLYDVLVVHASRHDVTSFFRIQRIHPRIEVIDVSGLIFQTAVYDIEEKCHAVFS